MITSSIKPTDSQRSNFRIVATRSACWSHGDTPYTPTCRSQLGVVECIGNLSLFENRSSESRLCTGTHCFCLKRRTLRRFPHSFISHHLLEWFLLISKKSHLHSALPHALTFELCSDPSRVAASIDSFQSGSSGAYRWFKVQVQIRRPCLQSNTLAFCASFMNELNSRSELSNGGRPATAL
jgi:hypothetical protein